ncbi:MAG: DoxX family protein [Rhodocyclaceae bacterium]|nr:DoxX family protein [Rhodocyclaceae bacterium]MBX3667490.1 DoxX family protein [Rhodocyclaceae bacterium]
MNALRSLLRAYFGASGLLDLVAPLFDLCLRAYVCYVFFASGLTKIQSWDSTIALFENEYAVPVLPPELAAYMGTAAELTLPVFLLLGLGARAFGIALFVFNVVAVLSYPDLSPAGVKDHILWGTIIAMIIFHGPGKLSIDHFLARHYAK